MTDNQKTLVELLELGDIDNYSMMKTFMMGMILGVTLNRASQDFLVSHMSMEESARSILMSKVGTSIPGTEDVFTKSHVDVLVEWFDQTNELLSNFLP